MNGQIAGIESGNRSPIVSVTSDSPGGFKGWSQHFGQKRHQSPRSTELSVALTSGGAWISP